MKVQKRQIVEYTVTLTPEEADWLRDLMRNPISKIQIPLDEEDEFDSSMRQKFFLALKDIRL